MDLIKERFFEVLKENRIKQIEFADAMGVPQGSVSSTLNKNKKVGKVDYYKTLQELTHCNLNWVISGVGEKYLIKETAGNLPLAAEATADYGDMRLMMDTYKNMAEKYDTMAAENAEIKQQLADVLEHLKKL